MPKFFLDTAANISVANWPVFGTTSPAYLAVRRGSGDSTGISATAFPANAILRLVTGAFPRAGVVGPFTVYYRYRQTDPLAVGAILVVHLRSGNTVLAVSGSLTPTGTWTTGSAQYRNTGTSRVSLADVQNLNIRIQLPAGPSSGRVEVSEVWAEEETADGIYRYDAVNAVLPDAVVGPLQWISLGTQPASISAGNFLDILDTSLVDARLYNLLVDPALLSQDYSTHMETRFCFPSFISFDGACYIALNYEDNDRSVTLNVFYQGGNYFLGLTSLTRDQDDPASYFSLVPWPGGMVAGTFYHLRMEINRSLDPHNLGRVEVFLDHATSPLLSVCYQDFDMGLFSPMVVFSTWINHVWVWIDYVAFETKKTKHTGFATWDPLEGSNCAVSADSTDPGICQLKPLLTLPDIVAGQSRYACKLSGGGASPCQVSQIVLLSAVTPATHQLDVEYRDDTTALAPLRATLQRSSDLWYWDDGTATWVAPFTYVDLSHSLTRIKSTAMSGIFVNSPETVIVTLGYNFSAPPLPEPHIWLYRVYLAQM